MVTTIEGYPVVDELLLVTIVLMIGEAPVVGGVFAVGRAPTISEGGEKEKGFWFCRRRL